VDTLPHVDVVDPVAALVLGDRPPLELLLVGGRPVVEKGTLVRVDADALAARSAAASTALLQRAGVVR
jgi:8-oxoguanine deaminase